MGDKLHVPAVRRKCARQDVHQRALAGTVLADQGVDLSRIKGERDSIQQRSARSACECLRV